MKGMRQSARIGVELSDRRIGTLLGVQEERLLLLDEYQTTFVALANNVETQTFWSRIGVVKWPVGFNHFLVQPFVLIPINAKEIRDNFPSNVHGLSFTSTIYWHDISADELSEEQKAAILDWLHSGGRLVINGPTTIAGLANSFLSPYLPLTDLKTSEANLTQAIDQLNKFSLERAPEYIDYGARIKSNLGFAPPPTKINPRKRTTNLSLIKMKKLSQSLNGNCLTR